MTRAFSLYKGCTVDWGKKGLSGKNIKLQTESASFAFVLVTVQLYSVISPSSTHPAHCKSENPDLFVCWPLAIWSCRGVCVCVRLLPQRLSLITYSLQGLYLLQLWCAHHLLIFCTHTCCSQWDSYTNNYMFTHTQTSTLSNERKLRMPP